MFVLLADPGTRRLLRLPKLFLNVLFAFDGMESGLFVRCSTLKRNGDKGESKAKPCTEEQSTEDLPCIAGVKHPRGNTLRFPESQMLFSNVTSCPFVIDFLSFSFLEVRVEEKHFSVLPQYVDNK